MEKTKRYSFFYDQYEIHERDVKATYKKDSKKSYRINFHTDEKSHLRNKEIQVEFVYDFDSHLDDINKVFYLDSTNSIEINFVDIPNHDKLASITMEYLLDYYKKRYDFLTESDVVNNKKGEIPNIVDVEFLEFPRKENVYRTITAGIKCNEFRIISISKTPTTLIDYTRDILFENIYQLKL